ncbi:M48 family metalloprotease [Candidatus Sumerlaeota bacterium]|nr:M48 family metalloprotease [Candidatus Sumerlaeota bacterium]MBI3736127.1 M48 family metalloprotease [Candidatus Sumerlaeota bacterium]
MNWNVVQSRRTLLRLLFILLASSFTGGCEVFDQTITPLFMISPEEEIQLGKKLQAEIEKKIKFVDDPQVVQYVRRVGEIVKANAPEKAAVPTQFFVVNDPEINAFAIPGGNMYVQTGLINAADDEAELASVLAHEYGHVIYRHGAKHISRAQSLKIGEQFLLGQNAGAATSLADFLGQLGLERYSRQDELQADSVAVPTLSRAGYDPNAMVSFFQTMKTKYGDTGGVLTYFSSHPATADRIQRVQQQIAVQPPKQGVRPITDLRRAQARLQDLGLGEK